MKKILNRFVEIWRPDFLKKLSKEENQKTTWKFWFFYNSIAALIVTIVVLFGFAGFYNDAKEYIADNYPDAKISIENGKLSTEGLDEPIFQEDEDGSVFVLDTKNAKYDESILDKYQKGVFISADKIFGKKSSVEMRTYDISQFKQNFSFTQAELQGLLDEYRVRIYSIVFAFVFTVLVFFYAGLRLISALWWALIFWVLALILNIKEMNFGKTYFVVLNFYFIVLLLQSIMFLVGVSIPFLTTLIFLILFSLNFWKIKKTDTPIVIGEQESRIDVGDQKEGTEENK